MAEFLSPGVFIQEVPAALNVVEGVSPSTMGIVGFTPKGPVNDATLVTSYRQFEQIFGSLSANSDLGYSMAAFYSNGGQRAWVVRVTPSDATSSTSNIDETLSLKHLLTGDGSTVNFTQLLAVTPFDVNGGDTPIVSSSVAIKFRGEGTAVPTGSITDDLTGLAMSGDAAKTDFSGVIDGLPTIDQDLHAIVPLAGTAVTINWTDTVGPQSIALAPSGTDFVLTGESTSTLSSATLDLRNGFLTLSMSGAEIADSFVITAAFTPATETLTITDDGAGNLIGDVDAGGTNTIGYATGDFDFDTAAAPAGAPHNNALVLVTYDREIVDCTVASPGIWGDDIRVSLRGHSDSYVAATGSYTTHDILVSLYDPGSETYSVVETFENLSLNDTASARYAPDVVNAGSDYITINEPANDIIPENLNGFARTQTLDSASGGAAAISGTLSPLPAIPRTVTITCTSGGATLTITDDGAGNLIGDVDAGGTNTINYTTGAVDVTASANLDADTLVTASFYQEAPDTTLSGDFAGGGDGTFGAGTYDRNQFTAPALQTNFLGMYALDKVDDILSVVIPDFPGDETIQGDMLDYAVIRAQRPAGGDRFMLLTTPSGLTAQEAYEWYKFDFARFSDYAALYWPWINIADPLAENRLRAMPPMAHIAGIYARTDSTKNVGKSPAGTVDGALGFLTSLEYESSQGERDLLVPNKINPLVTLPLAGPVVWGARTISSQSQWRYVNARRLFMFVEKSIYNSTQWIVFENNGPGLWQRISGQINGFLNSLFSQGYFAGTSPSQAYFAVVDATNNTPETIEQGKVIIDVGIAPNKPAEFVIFRFAQITASA